jgi:hypothetical protein
MGLVKIGNVFVDVAQRIAPKNPLAMSKYLREDGTFASNFIADENPLELEIECGVADGPTGTRKDKEEALKKIKADKEPVTITTDEESWPNMVLLDIQYERTVETAKSFRPTLLFQQSNTTTFAVTSVPLDKIADPVKKKVAKDSDKTVDDGNQPTEEEKDTKVVYDLIHKASNTLIGRK